MLWLQFLKPYSGADALFDATFIERWAKVEWNPTDCDKMAAAKLYVQMVSRIATQGLAYLDGVEKTALKSVYDLFEHTRTICTAHCDANHFTVLAWHVLNTHVRPFTAKWHPRSERGMLGALDTTDEFRAELESLQRRLRQFEELLAHLRDGHPLPVANTPGDDARVRAITEEMKKTVSWRISPTQGGLDETSAAGINKAEKDAIKMRRTHYGLEPEKKQAVALALSGGGIRSATFSLGVLVALARRGLLPDFDYLSTVSGGGYLGSFLTAYLNAPAANADSIGLRANDLPFRREGGEAEALRHLRHHSKYLATGSLADRLRMAGAQIYGMALNGVGVVFLAAALAFAEHSIRATGWPGKMWDAIHSLLARAPVGPLLQAMWATPLRLMGTLFSLWAVGSLVIIRRGRRCQKIADTGLIILGGIVVLHLVWLGLASGHEWVKSLPRQWPAISQTTLLTILGVIPIVSSALAGVLGKVFDRLKIVLGLLSAVAAPLFFVGLYFATFGWVGTTGVIFNLGSHGVTTAELLIGALAVVYLFFLNINFTSPHRHYRNKLAEAYLIQPTAKSQTARSPAEAVDVKLSEATTDRAPYHLINAALNVPGSKNPGMQGRLTDFFLFSPAFCGSPLTGYKETTQWEKKDKHLDLGTAMAISGAAAAPQMGLGTKKRLSFWLALLNVRLGYWVRNPARSAWRFGWTPGLLFLLKEMRGSMNERSPWLYLSDGGHIENLGVYELLRRRCQYIVAIDGEQDERMTFAALTTLQRLAAIDLGVKIDIDLDDLRLNEQGLSRSHFRFCRIEYPGKEYGYLLYVKLSLTGNEGEFLRRYRLDEPAFPHHSTADQFFTEAQFEAYRSLGEHIGEKLFLRALVGEDLAKADSVRIEDLFRELGTRFLAPLPSEDLSPTISSSPQGTP